MKAARLATVLATTSVLCTAPLSASAGESPQPAPAAVANPAGTPVPCDAGALVAAINQANTVGGGSLDLAAGCTYTLTSPQPDTLDGLPPITTPISINGNGATITRSHTPDTPAFRVFEVPAAGGALTISALTVSNGRTTGPDNGAGVFVHDGGSLTAETSHITRNVADFQGGGVLNDKGTVRITDSTLDNNTAFSGGGVHNEDGELTISRSFLRDNTIGDPGGGGGALFNLLGTVALTDSTVTGNTGDAVANFEHMNVSNTIFSGNTGRAGAAINNVGDLTVSHSLIAQNRTTELDGGGIINFRLAGILGTATIEDTTIRDNVAATSGGGVFVDSGTVTLTRSAVTNNSAANAPGGITNENGEVILNGSAVVQNHPTNCEGSPTPIPDCTN